MKTKAPSHRPGALHLAGLFLALGLLAGCSHCPVCGASWGAAQRERDAQLAQQAAPQLETLRGTITCLERVTPLPTYRLEVRLIDLESQQEIASQDLGTLQGFPVFFSIVYNARDIDAKHAYGLVCDLTSQGVPLYSTDTQYRVLSKDSADREVNLILTRRSSRNRNAGRPASH